MTKSLLKAIAVFRAVLDHLDRPPNVFIVSKLTGSHFAAQGKVDVQFEELPHQQQGAKVSMPCSVGNETGIAVLTIQVGWSRFSMKIRPLKSCGSSGSSCL